MYSPIGFAASNSSAKKTAICNHPLGVISEFLRTQKRKDQVDQQAGGQEEQKNVFKHRRARLSDDWQP